MDALNDVDAGKGVVGDAIAMLSEIEGLDPMYGKRLWETIHAYRIPYRVHWGDKCMEKTDKLCVIFGRADAIHRQFG